MDQLLEKQVINIVRVALIREKTDLPYMTRGVFNFCHAATLFRQFLGERDRECLLAMHLDIKNMVNNIEMIAVGSLNSLMVHPREVFKGAVLANAAAIILGHNHPSGDSTPSKEDIEFTRRMVEAGQVLGIQVIDHIILGYNTLTSLKEKFLMPTPKGGY